MGHWLSDVFTHPDPLGLLIIVGKTAAVYLFLVLGLRLLGKRELGQMTVYDLVLIIVLANSVQNAMVGDDTTLAGGLVAGTTLLILNRLLSLVLFRSRRIARVLIGDPLLIVNDGRMIPDHMRKEGVTREQILAALREHGMTRIEDAQMCVLEVDGTISVVPRGTNVLRSHHHFRALRLS